MNDIVEVLRGKYALDYDEKTLDQFCNEAADEIEKLRAERDMWRETATDAARMLHKAGEQFVVYANAHTKKRHIRRRSKSV